MDAAQKITSPFANVSSSLFEGLVTNIDMKGYGDAAAYAFLAMLLLFHLLFFCFENNTGMQKWSKQFREVLYETRVFLQVGVITQFVFWASFWVGIFMSRSQGDFFSTVIMGTPWIQLLVSIFLVNKVCQVLTARNGINPSAKWPFASANYTPVAGAVGDVVTGAVPALSDAKLKALYVLAYWLQNVTEIVLVNFPAGFMFGYAAGLAFPRQ